MRTLIAGVLLASLTACGPGSEERVLRSFAAMERVARTGTTSGPLTIGEAAFRSVHREGDRVYFTVGLNGPGVDPYGYVYSPDQVPVDDSDPSVSSSFEHVQGPWYRWSDSY
ncbi:hypothetical protein [Nonomuraea sp. NPDC048826]|uniref:hypothetical protein n=1 Tax=Nonomuraea sp. NPDC048826 TaxID=3364347 RepID=UPI0037137BDC